jgi:uncharacterized protein (DUF305 family)
VGHVKDKRLNHVLLAGFTALFVAAFWMGRSETFVNDDAFLRSMIPHHSRAILVCQESDLSDPDVIDLCEQIIESQQEEITQMEGILDRYNAEAASGQ